MTTIGTLEVEHESLVVLYDPQTGRIVHGHRVVTMKGGQPPDAETMEKDARQHLSHAQPEFTGNLVALHVDPHTLKDGIHHRVDTTKHVLVESPRPIAKHPR